jgi:hypothetical protein
MMAGLLGKIFGSGDVIKSGIALIDSFHTSTEEEILVKTKSKVDMMKAYAPFKLAQRYIALMFSFTFLFCFALTLLMVLTGQGDIEAVKSVLGDFYIGQIMLMIVTFYFGGGAIEGFMNSKGRK